MSHMNNKPRIVLLFWVLSVLLCSSVAHAEEIAVVASKNSKLSEITLDQIRQVYLGQSKLFRPYDQRKTSVIREAFYQRTTRRTIAQINSIWAKAQFGGRALKPEQLINSKAMISTVAKDTEGVGYIWASEVDEDDVKVLMLLPE